MYKIHNLCRIKLVFFNVQLKYTSNKNNPNQNKNLFTNYDDRSNLNSTHLSVISLTQIIHIDLYTY